MRTKTLLIAAAALAAAVTSSQAQSTVYSQNIVGYVNLGLTPGNYQLVAPALDFDGTGTNGTVSTVVGTNVASGTVVLIFNGTGYDTLNFSPVGKGSTTPVWNESVSGTIVVTNNYPLNCGEGFWINDPSDTNFTETGVVLEGVVTNEYVLPAENYSLLASAIPFGGDIATNLDYQANSGDSLLIYNGSGYNTYTYSPVGKGSSTPVWNTTIGGVITVEDPQISVGQGFWLDPAVNNTWVETFTNN